jgi:hypothetical protein
MIMKLLNNLLLLGFFFALQFVANATKPPQVFILNGNKMLESKNAYIAGKKDMEKSVSAVLRAGDRALEFAPVSVMDKTQIPVSGDKHDFVSLAKYWFPDPSSPNGLPYIRKDGVINPEVKLYKDYENLNKMSGAILDAAIAYYISTNEKYAEHASKLIRVWFLDATTRMNPNLKYAQAVKGSNDGRSWGVLEGQDFRKIIDAVGLIEGSSSWKKEYQEGLKTWMTSYFQWLTESENGIAESNAPNNHGTWYQVQAVSIALYLGKTDYAVQRCELAKEKRITAQIKPDGSQPFELERTKALSYSDFNLRALMELALLAENVGVDLWNYKTSDGRCIRLALDFMIPYVMKDKVWPYQQIEEFKTKDFILALYLASTKFKDTSYLGVIKNISDKELNSSSITLLY